MTEKTILRLFLYANLLTVCTHIQVFVMVIQDSA